MGFDPCNRTLKVQESIKTPTPKVGVHLQVRGFISLTLSHIPKSMKCDSQLSHLARTFASPCRGHESKARVATDTITWYN
jgi:hypothetical protein